MANGSANLMLSHLRTLLAPEPAPLSDGQLLERFAVHQDEAAFAALVRRYGPLVLGVCRRVLHDTHEAEDTFQATFLVLARKAGAISRRGSVAGWLYQVAYRAALKARTRTANRHRHERRVGRKSPADPLAEVSGRELLGLLDSEVRRLPERFREPLVLCYLDGRTRDEAARLLGWPVGTVKSRLARGRDLLRRRLTRRGVTLAGGLLPLALTESATGALPPVLLGSTTKAALPFATGPLSSHASALAEGVLQTMFATKLKWATLWVLVISLFSLGAGLLARQALAQNKDNERAKPADKGKQLPGTQGKTAPGSRRGNGSHGMIFAGRVLDDAGKPVIAAQVAVVVQPKAVWRRTAYRQEVLVQGQTDRQGRFHLAAREASTEQFLDLYLLAGGKGYGLGYHQLPYSANKQKEVVLRLQPEQVLRGRLFDIQGRPAAKVRARVVQVRSPVSPAKSSSTMAGSAGIGGGGGGTYAGTLAIIDQGFSFLDSRPRTDLSLWPKPVSTDGQGRFAIHGFGRGQAVQLLIEDDRFALQKLTLEMGRGKTPQVVRRSLAPPQRIEGRIICEDTGRPVPGAQLGVYSYRKFRPGEQCNGRTDQNGRFRLNLYAGDRFHLSVYAPAGGPYLSGYTNMVWPKGAIVHQMEIALPRGVLLQGKVVDQTTGQPVKGAKVWFRQFQDNLATGRKGLVIMAGNPILSQADGTFRLAAATCKGFLLCTVPGHDFIWRSIGTNLLTAGTPGGNRRYFHAVIPQDLKPQQGPKELTITVRRGVTVRGKVVGPDNKPVHNVAVFCPGELLRPDTDVFSIFQPSGGNIPRVMLVKDGTFELTKCDPERVYRVFFLDNPGQPRIQRGEVTLPEGRRRVEASTVVNTLLTKSKDRLGAAVGISAKQAKGQPITVKLLPCGSARVHFVDGQGKPARPNPWLEMAVTPQQGKGKATLQAEVVVLATWHTWNQTGALFRPDAGGRLTIPALIPGARYRLKARVGRAVVEQEITVEPGKMTVVPDIVVPHG
jgi:RNA polymerase sigma factor (sigma-70 family)